MPEEENIFHNQNVQQLAILGVGISISTISNNILKLMCYFDPKNPISNNSFYNGVGWLSLISLISIIIAFITQTIIICKYYPRNWVSCRICLRTIVLFFLILFLSCDLASNNLVSGFHNSGSNLQCYYTPSP